MTPKIPIFFFTPNDYKKNFFFFRHHYCRRRRFRTITLATICLSYTFLFMHKCDENMELYQNASNAFRKSLARSLSLSHAGGI